MTKNSKNGIYFRRFRKYFSEILIFSCVFRPDIWAPDFGGVIFFSAKGQLENLKEPKRLLLQRYRATII